MRESLRNETVEHALQKIGAKQSTPGGGAIAALLHALGAAAAQMTLNYSIGRPMLADRASLHEEAQEALDRLAASALDWCDADAEAFARLNELWKLPEDDPKRQAEFQDAVRAAIEPPKQVLDGSLELLNLLERLCGAVNEMLISDFAIASIAAEAAARAAAWNIRVNVPLLDDEDEGGELASHADGLLMEALKVQKQVARHCVLVHQNQQ